MFRIPPFLVILILIVGCGSNGDDEVITDPTLSEIEECAQSLVADPDEDVTSCEQTGELPNGNTVETTVSAEGVTLYPNGMFDFRFGRCSLSGDYIYRRNSMGDLCFCATFSVFPGFVACGVDVAQNHTSCNLCFNEAGSSIIEENTDEDYSLESINNSVLRAILE